MPHQIEYNPDKDYYSLLGIRPDSSIEEIKTIWRKKAFEIHPDRAQNSGQDIKDVNEAYSVLKDPEKRKIYNRKRALYIARTFKFKDTGLPEHYDPYAEAQLDKSHSHLSNWMDCMKEVLLKIMRRQM